MDIAFLDERISDTKAKIVAYGLAVDALLAGGIAEYRLDTGQSIQRVTKIDIDQLNKAIDNLTNRLVTYQARRNGASVIVRPAY